MKATLARVCLSLCLLALSACNDPAPAGNRHGSVVVAAPGAINDLATPTATGTSFLANFSTPTGTITSYDYRINGGTATALGGGSGTAITNQTTGLAVSVEVRAVGPGGAGPWSNVSTGDPGITLQCRFDNNDPTYGIGEANGSWRDNPVNVDTGSSGLKSYPDVGFSGGTGQTAAGAQTAMLAFCRDVRYFINSTAKVNIYFGRGRSRNFNLTSWSWFCCGNPASNGVFPTSGSIVTLDYSQYRALVAQLPSPEQRALYPDPGSFPAAFGGQMNIETWLKALIEQSDFNSTGFQFWLTFAPTSGFSFDWDLDTTSTGTSGAGPIKAYYIAWHELQQVGAFLTANQWALWQVFKSSGTHCTSLDFASGCYMSIDGGTTNLGTVNTVTPSGEQYDLVATGNPAVIYPSARRNQSFNNNAGVPGFGGNAGTAMQLPAGTFPFLPFHQPNDAKQWFMIWPASPWLQSQAGF